MLDRILVNMVISFALRQVEKFETGVDWAKVSADAETRIRQVVPGSWFDDEAAAVVRALIDGIKSVLGEKAQLEGLIRTIAGGDWPAASVALTRLLLEGWTPTSAASTRASNALVA